MVKTRLLFAVFLILFLSILIKLFYLQVLNPVNNADNAYLRTRKITPERGKILDRNGLPLAVNKPAYLMYFEPKKIANKYEFVKRIDDLTQIGEATIESKIDTSKDWVSVKNGIDIDLKNRLLATGLKGLGFDEETKRYYPEASLSSHLLGFVGKTRDGEDIGYFGIEGYYDKDLTGLAGVLKSERDFMDRPILIGIQEKVDAENGRSLYLTVDKSVQDIIKTKLKDALEKYQAKDGCVIVADPNTMEILGLACLPDFDVDKYYNFTEENFKNPTITDVYEPGSTFKPLIVAAAIENKKIKGNDTYDETGPMEIGGYTIRTWNNKYEGTISITRILEKSSNVGMVYIGEKLGQEKLLSAINNYGFGSMTGIDLQGENPGYLRPKSNWYPIDYATATFGQGIAVTPIQMITAFASIINGGTLYKPHVVLKIGANDRVNNIRPTKVRTVISPITSEIIKKMLVSTVENGEVAWAKPKGYTIGGKTGTAQIPIAGHYDPTKTVASFIGFAPADKPKFITLTIIREPKSSQWGSETAAPLFFEIAKELLVYYNIAPQ